jgi:hypothetical protein
MTKNLVIEFHHYKKPRKERKEGKRGKRGKEEQK